MKTRVLVLAVAETRTRIRDMMCPQLLEHGQEKEEEEATAVGAGVGTAA